MKKSIFNHIIPYEKNEQIILVNTLSGALDVVPEKYGRFLNGDCLAGDDEIISFLLKRRYLLEDEINEYETVIALYRLLKSLHRRNSQLKYVVIVTFNCNLKCSYCWQQKKLPAGKTETLSPQQVDKLFTAVRQLNEFIEEKSEKPPLLQLFGGEPLLRENANLVEQILSRCQELKLDAHITTNGANIGYFQDMILSYGVREIQVTIDGTEREHNRRRLGSDYHSLMNSLDSLITQDALYVKMRVNIDLSNIYTLCDLANEIIDRKWYTSKKFYAYLAPLRDCSFQSPLLIRQRIQLLQELHRQKELHPQLEVFDMLGWDGYNPVKSLQYSGRFPYPKPHICDVNLNQFVFAPDGTIHLCAEEAHGKWDLVGEYFPAFHLDLSAFNNIYESSFLELKKCPNCTLLPICGGGCRLMQEHEEFLAEYCRSVRQCFDYGVLKYIESEASN